MTSRLREMTLLDKWKLMELGFLDRDLSRSDLNVLRVLLKHADKNGYCFPGYKRIASCAKVTRRTAMRGVDNLEALAFVRVTRYEDGRSNDYQFEYRWPGDSEGTPP